MDKLQRTAYNVIAYPGKPPVQGLRIWNRLDGNRVALVWRNRGFSNADERESV